MKYSAIFEEWSPWVCSKTCGEGLAYRERISKHETKENYCDGSKIEQTYCSKISKLTPCGNKNYSFYQY